MKKLITIVLILVSQAAMADRESGGGDLPALEKAANLKPEDKYNFYKGWFIRAGLEGLAELEPLAWTEYLFEGRRKLTPSKLRAARQILWDLQISKDKEKFRLDEHLKNPETGEPRVAENTRDGDFILNPNEWNKKISEKYSLKANQVRKSFAVHEVLSQPGIDLESTGVFTFSSVLLNKEKLKKTKSKYDALLKAVFGQENPSHFYSCDAELYRRKGNDKVRVWQAPIPLRTYIRWSVGPGHMDSIKGKPIVRNPNYVSGTSSTCLTKALSTTGFAKPFMFSSDVLKFLYKMPESGDYLDVCYVMGDPQNTHRTHRWQGDARILLRIIDGDDPVWHKFNYVLNPLLLDGIDSGSLHYENYEMKFTCGRMAPGKFKLSKDRTKT